MRRHKTPKRRAPIDLAAARERALLQIRRPAREPHSLDAVIEERARLYLAAPPESRDFELHCWYCGLELVYPDKAGRRAWRGSLPPNARTRDHQTPSSRGGRGGTNIVSACPDCNTRKGDRTLEEFRAFEWQEGRPVWFWAELVRQWGVEERDAAA